MTIRLEQCFSCWSAPGKRSRLLWSNAPPPIKSVGVAAPMLSPKSSELNENVGARYPKPPAGSAGLPLPPPPPPLLSGLVALPLRLSASGQKEAQSRAASSCEEEECRFNGARNAKRAEWRWTPWCWE